MANVETGRRTVLAAKVLVRALRRPDRRRQRSLHRKGLFDLIIATTGGSTARSVDTVPSSKPRAILCSGDWIVRKPGSFSTVNDELGAGDEAGFRARQMEHQLCDFLRSAYPIKGNVRGSEFETLGHGGSGRRQGAPS